MLYPVSNYNPGNLNTISPALKPGDMVSARIFKVLSPYQKIVYIKNQPIIVNTNLPLKEGDILLLQLSEISPRWRFKLIKNFSRRSLPQLVQQLASYLGIEPEPFNLGFLKYAFLLQSTINPLHLKILKHLDASTRSRESQQILLAYFYQQQMVESHPLPADLFPQWLIGQFRFLEEIKKFRMHLFQKASEEELSALLFQSSTFLQKEFFEKLGGFLESRLSRYELNGQHHNFPDIQSLKAWLLKENNIPQSTRLINAIHFLQFQYWRWQKGKWAAFPFFQKEKDSFFFIKKNQLNYKNIDINFCFDVETQKFKRVTIDGHVKGDNIFLEIQNSLQDFRKQVDDKIFLLEGMVKKLGFKTIEIRHRKTTNETFALKEIFTKEFLTMNWKI